MGGAAVAAQDWLQPRPTLWRLSSACNGRLSFWVKDYNVNGLWGVYKSAFDVSRLAKRALFPLCNGTYTMALLRWNLLCLAVHHLGVVHDGVIFYERRV